MDRNVEDEAKSDNVVIISVLLKERFTAHRRFVKSFLKDKESFVFTFIRGDI